MIDLENVSFDHCIKCTVCTAYCPVARVTALYPGPKRSGPDTERLRIKNPELLDASLPLCDNCKRCEIACPSDVKIADIIQAAKWKYAPQRLPLRDFLLSRTDLLGSAATRVSPLVNLSTGMPPVKFLLDRMLHIPSARTFPKYAQGTFRRWFRKQAASQEQWKRKVVYFHGCYVNYNDHGLGRDVVRVLNALGFGVVIAREKCCGVPLIANGDLAKARANAAHNLSALSGLLRTAGMKIVSASSSCSLALKHEYPNLLGMKTRGLENRVQYITRFLSERFEDGEPLPMRPLGLTVAYHSPCHLERMGGVAYTVDVLQRIPGLRLKVLHSECCGLAGTYGFKSEHYRISQDVGRELFERIDAARPDLVVTDCETCKWQIEMSTPYEVVHPVTLLARALG
jgi:glycerol-3-phosphate dehydrogenase subunit C